MDNPDLLLTRVAALVPAMRSRAGALDEAAQFAAADLADLRAAGCLAAPIPEQLDGPGIGIDPIQAPAALAMLRLIGAGNLSVGRVIEGHVNALRLVMVYGNDAARRQAAADARDGHLFALWIAEAEPLRLTRAGALSGRKAFGSAVGAATRALGERDGRCRRRRAGTGRCRPPRRRGRAARPSAAGNARRRQRRDRLS